MTSSPPVSPSATQLSLIADALAWPLLLLRRDGGLMHANLAARQVLRRGQPLALTPQRRVQPARSEGREAFAAALAAARAAPCMLRWPGPLGAVVATVSALPLAGEAHDDGVLVALSPGGHGEAETVRFARAHDLTEAELRVLRRLARGDSSSQAAQALGVSQATVRSQTVSLRRKTGHASVAALVRSLASLPPLLPAVVSEGPSEGE
jgi:DNA-binding CsgD family transcriptional regulator